MRPALELLPALADLAGRAGEFLAANPGSEIGGPLGDRSGCVVVSGKPREVKADTLDELLDEMDRLAALEAARVTLQADYPGRRVWLSAGYRWYATRLGADAQWHVLEDDAFRSREMTLDADDEKGLRALLAAERGRVMAVTGAEAGQEPIVLRDKTAAEMAIGAWLLEEAGHGRKAAALRDDLAVYLASPADRPGEPGG